MKESGIITCDNAAHRCPFTVEKSLIFFHIVVTRIRIIFMVITVHQ